MLALVASFASLAGFLFGCAGRAEHGCLLAAAGRAGPAGHSFDALPPLPSPPLPLFQL